MVVKSKWARKCVLHGSLAQRRSILLSWRRLATLIISRNLLPSQALPRVEVCTRCCLPAHHLLHLRSACASHGNSCTSSLPPRCLVQRTPAPDLPALHTTASTALVGTWQRRCDRQRQQLAFPVRLGSCNPAPPAVCRWHGVAGPPSPGLC